MSDNLKQKRWYAFLGGDPLATESYQAITLNPLCSSGRNLCAIYVYGYEDQPERLSPEMKVHIANALATAAPQPQFPNIPVVVMR